MKSWRDDFVDALESRGFRSDAVDVLRGSVVTVAGPQSVTVDLSAGFPFLPPVVRLLAEDLPRSWHITATGVLCLYTSDDSNSAPWRDVGAFVERIQEWFVQSAAGWPSDMPLLDVDAYLPVDPVSKVVVYPDLDPFVGGYVRLRHSNHNVVHVEVAPSVPRRSNGTKPPPFGRVADVGELLLPLRGWADIAEVMPDAVAVEADVKLGRVGTLLLRYTRGGRVGVLALRVRPTRDGIEVSTYRSASGQVDDLRFRSGPDAAVLADKRIAVVGVGAVGSFLADALARDGVGHIDLWDGDVLMPGNVVRHLCGVKHVGMNKALAVAESITPVVSVNAEPKYLVDPADAEALIADHDLVVDASADGAVTTMLHRAAVATGTHVLSVCIQNDGDIVRVDVLPPRDAAQVLPATVLRAADGDALVHLDSGCGDPVSPTPPHAVLAAAALAARHAVATLTGRPLSNNGEIVRTGMQTTAADLRAS